MYPTGRATPRTTSTDEAAVLISVVNRTADTAATVRHSQSCEIAKQMLTPEQIELFKELGIFDQMVAKIESQALITTHDDDGGEVFVGDDSWVDCHVDITLDSGCVDHIIDLGDAPGYAAFLVDSEGSKRKHGYLVGNGARVPNQGQINLMLEHNKGLTDGVNLIKSTFQVAGVTRPLMSVSRVCDLGMECRFKKDEALIVNSDGNTVAKFSRVGGLYVARMKLKPPEGFNGQVPR